MLPPFSCAYVKGWKRGVTLLIALHGIRELGLEGEIPHWVKAPFTSFSFYSLGHLHLGLTSDYIIICWPCSESKDESLV